MFYILPAVAGKNTDASQKTHLVIVLVDVLIQLMQGDKVI